jgi:hypothetical protein
MKSCSSLNHWQSIIHYEDHLDQCPLCAMQQRLETQARDHHNEVNGLKHRVEQAEQQRDWAESALRRRGVEPV